MTTAARRTDAGPRSSESRRVPLPPAFTERMEPCRIWDLVAPWDPCPACARLPEELKAMGMQPIGDR